MKHPKTIEDWKSEFARLDTISKRQALTDYQSARLQRAVNMIDHDGNPPAYNPEWPADEVNQMAGIIADGNSFGDVAKALGRSRSACIGRWRKVVRGLGWQAA